MTKKLIFLLLVLVLTACAPVNAPDYSQIKVIQVIDGDTVKLQNGKLLRYIGIDTPETRIKKGGKFIYAPQPFAIEAKELNQKLVEGKTVTVEFDIEKTDKYGRLLGYCFVEGTFVNAKLIEEGLAALYTYPPNVQYADSFVTAQKKSRAEKKGLWAAYEVINQTQANHYVNQIRIVRGKVINAHQSSKCVFLNFGYDWRTDFSVVIFNNSLDAFRKQGIDPVTFYKGREVEVTGRIKEYNGPEIIVNSPHEIEVIK